MGSMPLQDVLYISAEAVIGAITVAGNVIVLIAILRNKKLHTITNVFVSNLAVADIAVGVFVAPCAALSYLGLPRNKLGCIFINCIILMFTNISILMLLTIAVERFIAIRFPFVYERHMTIKMAIWINVSIWIIGSLLGLLPLFGWNIAPEEVSFCAFTQMISMEYMVYFQFFGLIIVPLFLMLCIYLYILAIVREQMRKTRTLQNLFHGEGSAPRKSRWNKDVQAAKMFALLFFLFGAFWLPVNILNSITLFCPSCVTPYEVLLTAIVLSHANSSINPFLYAASNSRIKAAIKVMFRMKLSEEELKTSTDGKSTFRNNRMNGVTTVGQQIKMDGQNPNAHTNACLDGSEKGNSVNDNDEADAVASTSGPTSEACNDRHASVSIDSDSLKGSNEENTRFYNSLPVLEHLSSSPRSNNSQIQTHSWRGKTDEVDKLTPLDGMKTTLFDSVPDDTLNLVLTPRADNSPKEDGKGNDVSYCAHISPWSNGNLKVSQTTSLPIRGSLLTTSQNEGHINHGFIHDSSDDCSRVSGKTAEVSEPDIYSSHSVSNSTLHRYSNGLSRPNKPQISEQQQYSRSFRFPESVQSPPQDQSHNSTYLCSDPISQTSTNKPSHPTMTKGEPKSTLTEHSTEQIPPPVFPGRSSTSKYAHFVIEAEMDNLMSVKNVQESQHKFVSQSSSKPDLSEDGSLKNSATERTRL